jgi:hypothetical protein
MFDKLQSLTARLVMIYHPLAYLYYSSIIFAGSTRWDDSSIAIYLISLIILIYLGQWNFIISELFQKPILFDPNTEEEYKIDMTILTNAVESQTKTMNELVKLLKEKETTNASDAV